MRYAIMVELNGGEDDYGPFIAALDEFGAVQAAENLWVVNWGKRTRTSHILGKLTALLQNNDRALVVCLDNPEWHGANLEANLDKIKPASPKAANPSPGLEIQGSNGVN